jgi:hypothetical protein
LSERRIKKGVKLKIVFNFDVKDLDEKREKLKFTEVIYLSEKFITPTWI